MVYILQLDSDQLFRYVSNGCFLTDCFLLESEYEQLLYQALLPDFNHLEEFMKTFAGSNHNVLEQIRWILISREQPNKKSQQPA